MISDAPKRLFLPNICTRHGLYLRVRKKFVMKNLTPRHVLPGEGKGHTPPIGSVHRRRATLPDRRQNRVTARTALAAKCVVCRRGYTLAADGLAQQYLTREKHGMYMAYSSMPSSGSQSGAQHADDRNCKILAQHHQRRNRHRRHPDAFWPNPGDTQAEERPQPKSQFDPAPLAEG